MNHLSNISLGIEISNHFKNIEEVKFIECTNCNLKFYYPIVSGSQSYYDELSNFPWYYQDEKDEYDFASSYINANDKVLEVGCGEGKFSEKIECKNYTGIEFSSNAIKKAAGRGVKVINESIESHAKNNHGKYDVVCTFQVLEHVSNINEFLNSCIDCLSENGLLIISVPNNDSYIGKMKNDILNLPPHHVSRWNEKVFRKFPELFNLKLKTIHKERVRDEHLQGFSETVMLGKINSKGGLIDSSLIYKIKRKFVSNFGWLFFKKYDDKNSRPDGHSITAVFRKC